MSRLVKIQNLREKSYEDESRFAVNFYRRNSFLENTSDLVGETRWWKFCSKGKKDVEKILWFLITVRIA